MAGLALAGMLLSEHVWPEERGRDVHVPDAQRAIADLSRKEQIDRQYITPWGQVDFGVADARNHVELLAVRKLDRLGHVEECRTCGVSIAAVTYRNAGRGWKLVFVETHLAEAGSWGKPPSHPQVRVLQIGSLPALGIEDTSSGQGYSETIVHLQAYDGRWRLIGRIPIGGDNAGTIECATHDEQCWAWSGKLRVLPSRGHDLPDILVECDGTRPGAKPGEISNAKNAVYQFSGSRYEPRHR